MRKWLLAGIILLLLPWIMSLFWMRTAGAGAKAGGDTKADQTAVTGQAVLTDPTVAAGQAAGQVQDDGVTPRRILMKRSGIQTYMPVEAYLPGAIACQINPDYSLEAMKCQAVIARTYIYRLMDSRREINEEELDLDYLEEDAGRYPAGGVSKVWVKERIAENLERCRQAAEATDHIVMKQEDRCILPLFHALNNGRTRKGEDTCPYLQSTESRWDARREDSSVILEWSKADFAAKINQIPDAVPITAAVLPEQIQTVKKDDAGYVLQVKIGAKTYSGEEIQYALGLGSSCFALDGSEDGIRATVRGSGHGYGLSQAGAEGMALEGWTYQDILHYYFKDITLVTER